MPPKLEQANTGPSTLFITLYGWREALKTTTPYFMVFGVFLWLFAYYLFCEGWALPRFNKIPGKAVQGMELEGIPLIAQ